MKTFLEIVMLWQNNSFLKLYLNIIYFIVDLQNVVRNIYEIKTIDIHNKFGMKHTLFYYFRHHIHS